MSLIIDSTTKDLVPWADAFKAKLPADEVVLWEENPDLSKVTTAVVWNHRKELFQHLPNLKLVCSLGAGVDHIMNDTSLPSDVEVTRIISEELSEPMSNFCIGAILYFQRQFDKYARDKVNRAWDQEFDPERGRKVGIMGLGELGQNLAAKLVMLGFEVSGLSQRKKQLDGVTSFQMEEQEAFLKSINILVVMLPATSATKRILSMPLFQKMNRGSFLINVARGHHQVDDDIVLALDEGILDGAFLDVFPKEPLPFQSPLWEHPKVFITPHIAVVTKINAALPQIVNNHYNTLKGEPLFGVVDRKKGY